MDMFDHVNFLHALFAFTRDVAKRIAALYIEAGMDVIAVVDPMISQISPRHFEQFFMGPFTDIFDFIRGRDVFSSFFVCGDATKNIEVMCQTNPDSISIDENIDIAQAKSITDRYNITIGGNIPLTTTMLLGTQQDNMKFVVDLLDRVDPHNLIISPGCDMPYETPIENVIAVGQAIRDPETAKQMLVNYHAEELSFEVDLPDYESLEKPLIEVFTLDSSTCAACSYMLGAAQRAADELAGKVDLVEYKFNRPENIARVKAMGVQKLPSIYVNGKLQYSSLIPSNRELLETIEKYIARSEQETS
jgi:uroporphyrinogen decarboxylase